MLRFTLIKKIKKKTGSEISTENQISTEQFEHHIHKREEFSIMMMIKISKLKSTITIIKLFREQNNFRKI